MSAAGFAVKRRALWRPDALQLLRERPCAYYASRAVPDTAGGWRIRFPQVKATLGLRVTVRSELLPGRPLIELLYQPELQELAIDAGLAVLHALEQADIRSFPVAGFSAWYDRLRLPAVALAELGRGSLLTTGQRRAFNRLVSDYIAHRRGPRVLVHGDLQATHLLIDTAAHAMGIIDLEAMREGKAATNFAQLWEAYYFADPSLGLRFYTAYRRAAAATLGDRFDADVRAELALRCYSHIRAGRRTGNDLMIDLSRSLLTRILDGATFEEISLGNTTNRS